MGVELPVLCHLATTQNRVAPPPDGTKSCAKLSFLPVIQGSSSALFFPSKTLLQKAGPGATVETALYGAREFGDRIEGLPAPSIPHDYILAPDNPHHIHFRYTH